MTEPGADTGADASAAKTARKKIPELAAILAWAVPGLGHYYLGQRGKAVILFSAIVFAFVLGIILADFEAVSIPEHQYAFFAQMGTGAPTLITLVITGGEIGEKGRAVDPLNSIGLLYTMVAGLLNYVVACDAYERAVKGKYGNG